MKKVVVVCDVKFWAFYNLFRALKKYLTSWQIDDTYTTECSIVKHTNYDVILFLCDYQVGLIRWNKIPKEKTILAIRSNVKLRFYENEDLNDVASIIAVANSSLKDRFDKLHKNVVLAPGGVDLNIFKFQPKSLSSKLRIGWSGSRSNFGGGLRGLNLIIQACQETGHKFVPAFREDKWRTLEEMNDYYHNEIDIYVDMSFEAGRQNGLLEAAACGVPVIASRAGFSEQLIKNNENGLLCDRNVESLKTCLNNVQEKHSDYVYKMFDVVKKKWSWEVQSIVFEKMFKQIIDIKST